MSEWKLWTLAGPSFLKARGNQTGQDAPIAVSNSFHQCDSVLQLRQGFDDDAIAAGLGGTTRWIGRHVTNSGAAPSGGSAGPEEAWAVSDDSGTAAWARRSAATWAAVTFSDAANTSRLHQVQSATQNGKLFIAYAVTGSSADNRLHVWDGSSVRRVGLALPSAPTVATLGGAGITATRYYRVRWAVLSGSTVLRRSEPSASANLALVDDSGWQVTRPTAAGEGETHWEVEAASADAGPWYRLSQVVIATTTYNDTTSSISTTNLTDQTGLYVPPPSVKYILTDGSVLVMAGAWESTAASGQTVPFNNRVWFTRPLGSTDVSDDESITQTASLDNFIDIGDAGPITGLAGPFYGDIFVFKANSIYKLIPTGNLETPYQRVQVHNSIGAIDQTAIAQGLWKGLPAIYFVSLRNIWVLHGRGLEQIGDDILGGELSVNRLKGPSSASMAFARLIWSDDTQTLWLVTGAGNPVTHTGWLFDSVKGGWVSQDPGTYNAIRGANIDGLLFVVGGSTTSRVGVQRAADELGFVGTDIATAVTASVTYRKPFAALSGHRVQIGNPTVFYRKPEGTTAAFKCTITYRKDGDSAQDRSGDFILSSSNPTVYKTLEDVKMPDVATLDVTISLALDSGQSTQLILEPPSIDAVQIPYRLQEALPR